LLAEALEPDPLAMPPRSEQMKSLLDEHRFADTSTDAGHPDQAERLEFFDLQPQ
jgi:hypothetical protein